MATLVFSALGTVVGGPLGGVVGALVGQQVDSAILGGGNIKGPRLKELGVTSSSYGTPLARHFGRMRVPGSVIWSTDLVESSETQGGKNQPSVTTYSYSVSFAVALASRPILGIGRIWADGKLLRGEAGDLKVDGLMRLYTGERDQQPDPLIAEAEGADRCPAYRGLAYVVFEELDLSEFYNRLPALTFEVIADDSFSLADLVSEVIPESDADLSLEGIAGFSCEGPLVDTLQSLETAFQLDADASGETLTITRERLQTQPLALPEPAIAVDDGDFGGASGFARNRAPTRERSPEVLRYYDIDRDYLPGLQRAQGRPTPGQPRTLEFEASMTSASARTIVERTKQRADWSRDRIAWRTTELDPEVSPGSVTVLPDRQGRWRVREWEWRASGVELWLERVVPTGADEQPGGQTDPGRINPPPDLLPAPTVLQAFELPWDGNGGGDAPSTFAAASSPGANWAGAALFADHGNGELQSLGPTGRTRCILGAAIDALPARNPLIVDRESSVTVELASADFQLTNASSRQIASGANLALLGEEIVQFASAEPVDNARWVLSGLVRGRGGTETAIGSHAPGEAFVLLDGRLLPLDPAVVGTASGTTIIASGRGDPEPVESAIGLRGITVRPLIPVHARNASLPDGSLELCWTRRARGAWSWPDGVDVPLHEQSESYLVTYGPLSAPVASWQVSEPRITLAPAELSNLSSTLSNGEFHVRQQGSYALSTPLFLSNLT